MWRSIIVGEWRQNLVDRCFVDVYQHVGVREPLHCPDLISLRLGHDTVQGLSTVVLLQDLAVRYRRHPVIVKFEPPGFPIRFDESEVVPAV